ncbi:phosphatidylinositol N-acetylglucosaminyltransferase subunit gpi1 [Mortierella sp. AM989]|nr:phosphatidylinositol N-acetylglucosaminyltransferase subunit gpi1 [Mortierella sp. AM989]
MDAKAVADSNARLLASRSLLEHKRTANLWLTIEVKPTYIPSLSSLHCCGFGYNNVSSEIIFYRQPDPRSFQFLSLDPLILDISKINASGALFDAAMSPKAAQKRMKSSTSHSRLFMPSSGRTVTDDMNVTLQQINSSYKMEQAVHAKAKNFLRRRARSRSMSEAVRESAVDLSIKVRSKLAITATTLWPIIQPFATRALMVIFFYNSMWLVANDIIIGLTLKSFLINHNEYMGEVLQRYVKDYTIDSISAVLDWLTSKNEYPAGLKLNPELNPFLGQLFKWLIELWAGMTYSIDYGKCTSRQYYVANLSS